MSMPRWGAGSALSRLLWTTVSLSCILGSAPLAVGRVGLARVGEVDFSAGKPQRVFDALKSYWQECVDDASPTGPATVSLEALARSAVDSEDAGAREAVLAALLTPGFGHTYFRVLPGSKDFAAGACAGADSDADAGAGGLDLAVQPRSASQAKRLSADADYQRRLFWAETAIAGLSSELARENVRALCPPVEADDHLALCCMRAVQQGNTQSQAALPSLLKSLGLSNSAGGASQLLQLWGLWPRHANLAYARSPALLNRTAECDIDLSMATSPDVRLNSREQEQLDAILRRVAREESAGYLNLVRNGTFPPEEDGTQRVDLRHLRVYAIDGEGADEIDDALSVEELEGGVTRVWVHIADPTRYLPPGSPVALGALARASSVYGIAGTIGMLPRKLLEEAGCSLGPAGRDCYALSVALTAGEDGALKSVHFVPSVVRLAYQLTYGQVDEMLYDGIADFEEPDIGRLHRWAQRRRAYRISNGATDEVLDWLPKASVKLRRLGGSAVPLPTPLEQLSEDARRATRFEAAAREAGAADGAPGPFEGPLPPAGGAGAGADAVPRGDDYGISVVAEAPSASPAQVLVTEMMLAANEAAAMWACARRVPLPFRRQAKSAEQPPLDGGAAGDAPAARGWAINRHFQRVEVAPVAGTHNCLGLKAYAQWTSPLRRGLDLVVHWQIKAALVASRREREGEGAGGAEGGAKLQERRGRNKQAATGKPQRRKAARARSGLALSDEEAVKRATARVMRSMRVVNGIHGWTARYWQLEFLRRGAARGKTYEAVILGPPRTTAAAGARAGAAAAADGPEQVVAMLKDSAIQVTLSLPLTTADGQQIGAAPGAEVILRVERCQPEDGVLEMVPAAAGEAVAAEAGRA